MLAASVSPSTYIDRANRDSGSRGPAHGSGKRRGGGRGGRGDVLRGRNSFKVKNIVGVEVARPRHSSSSYMGPNSAASKAIFAECAKRNGGKR